MAAGFKFFDTRNKLFQSDLQHKVFLATFITVALER
ncbi:hypothetical protein PE36_07237 [Moritella sp. PE36]|nr:hypothetical protein PE36_07237 [Moritella sp. PE36]